MNDNYHNAMNAPIQHNSDMSDPDADIESNWEWMADMGRRGLLALALVALAAWFALYLVGKL